MLEECATYGCEKPAVKEFGKLVTSYYCEECYKNLEYLSQERPTMKKRARNPNGTYNCEESYFDSRTFSIDIARVRKSLNLTQYRLCENLDICKKNYGKWERHLTIPTTEFFLLLCYTFDLNPIHYFKRPTP